LRDALAELVDNAIGLAIGAGSGALCAPIGATAVCAAVLGGAGSALGYVVGQLIRRQSVNVALVIVRLVSGGLAGRWAWKAFDKLPIKWRVKIAYAVFRALAAAQRVVNKYVPKVAYMVYRFGYALMDRMY
jgi:hypothetical protein